MKKVLQGLFSVKAFRNNYLAAATITALFTLLQVSVYAQPNSSLASSPKYDTTRVLQPINADGFYWTGVGKFGGGLVLPNDTFHLSIQSKGALAYKNLKLYEYTGSYWVEAGFKRWFVSPDGSINITNNGDTIKATVTNAPNSSSPGNYIILYPTIERSNDTVDVIPNVVFQQGSLRDTITIGAQYVVPYASAGQKRIDPIIIDPSGLLDTLQGVEDSFFAVRPDLAAGSIVIADINVYGVDSIVVSNVGLFPQTALGYFDANGEITGDSTKYFVGSNTLNAPAFKSNVVGGVALSIDGGSAIRAERGSRIVYIDGDSSVTLRSGGYNHKAQLTAQGEFIIGSSGQVRIPSARLAVIDSTKGFLPPVMRGVRMNAISSPATGLIIYNSDSASLCLYNGSAWVKLGSGGSGSTPTLQQAWEADSVSYPAINARYNQFSFKSDLGMEMIAPTVFLGQNIDGNQATIQSNTVTSGNQYIDFFAQNNQVGSTDAAAMRMNPTGLSIGFTHFDPEARLHINGFGAANAAVFTDGNVGVGTTTPDSTLTVVGGVAMPNLYESADGTDSMVVRNADGGLGIRAIPAGGSTTDSVQIGNDWFYTTKITLTPAEVYTLNSVPVDAVVAPGAGFAYSIIKASIRQDYNTTDYNDAVIVFLSINGVNSVSSQNAIIGSSGDIGCSFISTETGLDFTENQPIQITSDTDTSLGDSDIIIYIYYTKITL